MKNVEGPNISMTIMGIKCDNPSCTFADMSVQVEEYPLWLNKPCPKCGANLLTQADYDLVKKQLAVGELLNMLNLSEAGQQPQVRMYGSYDGSGKATYSEMEIVEE